MAETEPEVSAGDPGGDVEPSSPVNAPATDDADRDSLVRSKLGPKRRRRLLLEMTAVLSIGYVPALLNAAIGLVRYGAHSHAPTAEHLYYLLQSGVLSAVPVLYIMHRSKEDWAHFGIVRPNAKRDIGLTLAVLIAQFVWARLWGKIMGPSLGLFTIDAPSARPTIAAIVLLVPSRLASAFGEELAMRGYLIPRLEVLLGRKEGAVVFSSLAFASYHIYQGPDAVIDVFMIGLLYGIGFTLTRRLWPFALAHAAHNAVLDVLRWM